ncbi:MAG: ABC transporter permease [Planctomycetota bacterium]
MRLLPELPLLRRELIEQANRRRTYILRFIGAIAILSLVLLRFSSSLTSPFAGIQARTPNPFQGSGGRIFRELIPILFRFVELLMPALICGSIAMEKERNTLGTLFVTRLSPMTIVFEKLASRLIPMFSFLLLTFPVMAFVYSLGGVDTDLLVATMWLLFVESILFASIGLMCSSFFSTTVTAFIWAYVFTGLLIVISSLIPGLTGYWIWTSQFQQAPMIVFGAAPSWFTPPQFMADATLSSASKMFRLFIISLPILLFSGACILLTRLFLYRRAFVSSSSILLRLFKAVDAFFTRLNDRTTGGVVIVKDHNSLPAFDPVAWRERSKKSLGKARYLFRILLVLEGPALFICVTAASTGQGIEPLRAILTLMWCIAAIILIVKSSTMISSERTRETLDALLSTPLTGREILQQKIDGIRRLMIVLSVPIFSIHFTLWLMHVDGTTFFRNLLSFLNLPATVAAILYPVFCAATTYFLMHLICWTSAYLGLRAASQARSVTRAIVVMGSFCAIILSLSAFSYRETSGFVLLPVNLLRPELSVLSNEQLLMTLNPGMSGFRRREFFFPPPNALVGGSQSNTDYYYSGNPYSSNRLSMGQAEAMCLLSLAFLAGFTFFARYWTLHRASHLLGRNDITSEDGFFRRRDGTSSELLQESKGSLA